MVSSGTPVLVSEVVDIVIEELMADAELATGVTLEGRIFPDMADGDIYPVLVVSGVSGENTRTLNSTHVWRSVVIQIAARDKGGTNKSKLVLIARRVSIVLEGKRIQRNGMYIGKFTEARERPRGPDDIDGDLYPQIVLEYETNAYRP